MISHVNASSDVATSYRRVVRIDESAHQLRHPVAKLGRVREPRKRQLADLVRVRPGERIGPQLGDPLGRLDGDLLDLHPARGREDDHQAAAIAVERDAEVELGVDAEPGLAPDAPHRVAANVHGQDPRGLALRLLGGVDDGDAARLASSADRHLRLDRDATELASGRRRLLRGPRQPARRDRDAGRCESLLRLVLEELHRRAVRGGSSTRSDAVQLLQVGRARAPPSGASVGAHLLR